MPDSTNLPAPIEQGDMMATELSIEQVKSRVRKVHQLMRDVMKNGVHYGQVPGVAGKPTLLKPGAELINVMFMFGPEYKHEVIRDGVHREYLSLCTLRHIPTQVIVGTGEGSCSTYEAKYAYRIAGSECPDCKRPGLKRSNKNQVWFCAKADGGCGHNFPFSDKRISRGERIPNPDIPDQWNTVLKIANKRSLVAASLNATGASDVFTQDMDDRDESEDPGPPADDLPPPPEPMITGRSVPRNGKPVEHASGLISETEFIALKQDAIDHFGDKKLAWEAMAEIGRRDEFKGAGGSVRGLRSGAEVEAFRAELFKLPGKNIREPGAEG